MELAPIGVSTYSRINHLKQTIEALQKNTLAKQSELYIFSDAPQKGDEEIVAKVREYIHTVDGFKKVHIVERETNGRVANNRGGMKQLLDQYGKMIFLEDDIVTSSIFLEYLNNALMFYENDKRVLGISAYVSNVNCLKDRDVFLSKDFSVWGFATWKSRNILEIGKISNYFSLVKSNNQILSYLQKYNKDMLYALYKIQYKNIEALDIKLNIYNILNNTYSIKPKNSLVQNIGFDNSGVHCKKTKRFNTNLSHSLPELSKISYIPENDICIFNYMFKAENTFQSFKKTVKFIIARYLLSFRR